jgi:hypothetical protein
MKDILMIEAAEASETSVSFYHRTQRNITDDRNLHDHYHENLIPERIFLLFTLS